MATLLGVNTTSGRQPTTTRAVLARIAAAGLGVLLVTGVVSARLPEPDHIIYGAVTVFGETPTGGVVTLAVNDDPTPVATFAIGSRPELGNSFIMRVPIDAVDPRLPGTARPGDEAHFFIDGEAAGSTTIGERGSVQLYDVDPENAEPLPALRINDVTVIEGDSGTTAAVFTISLSEPSGSPVTVDWATADGSATWGSGDYVQAGDMATIPTGDLSVTVEVLVNGDTAMEQDEDFYVNLSSPSANAVLGDPNGTGTIADDDTPPEISVNDVWVREPHSGSVEAVFRVSLNHAWDQDVTFSYATSDGTGDSAATAGLDYLSTSGVGLIPATPAGRAPILSTTISVEILADAVDELPEYYLLQLSDPGNATILEGEGVGTISDAIQFLTYQETHGGSVELGGPLGLLGAFATLVSPDNAHVYVAGRQSDAISVFERDPASGRLTWIQTVKDGVDDVNGLNGVEDLAFSPDGEHLYAAGFDDNAVAVFACDTDSGSPDFGTLTFVEAVVDADVQNIDGSAVTVEGLRGAAGVRVSGDGLHVYVAGTGRSTDTGYGAVVVFDRETDSGSPDFGTLAFREAEWDGLDDPGDGGGTVNGLEGASALALSADGEHLYATGSLEGGLAVFRRETDPGNAHFGELSFIEAKIDDISGVDGLAGGTTVAVSGDGHHVYVGGLEDNGVAAFSRNTDSGSPSFGRVSFLSVTRNQTGGTQGLLGVSELMLSRDDEYLYTVGFNSDALTTFHRDPATGALTFVEDKLEGREGVLGLDGANGVGVSQDDLSVYVAGTTSNAVAVFQRDVLAPSDPSPIASFTHVPNVYSNNDTIQIEWQGAEDNPDGSGIDGYSIAFDTSPTLLTDEVVDIDHTSDPHYASSGPKADGDSYYFHLRTCDRAGNCSQTCGVGGCVDPVNLGPYLIDTVAPTVPGNVHSTTHTPGVGGDPVITMEWTASADTGTFMSGLAGYATRFSNSSAPVCAPTLDLDETATAVSSATLANGNWYFHICAGDAAGNRSPIVTLGPYIVGGDTIPPKVAAVRTVARTGDGILSQNESTDVGITQLLLEFDEAMNDPTGDTDPGDVTNPASYGLVEAGPDGVLETVDCGVPAGDDLTVAVTGVTYLSASTTAALRLPTPYALGEGRYRVFVCSTNPVTDLTLNPIDGNGDGIGGDPFARTFNVTVNNLLSNPNLDLPLDPHWNPSGNLPSEVTRSGATDRDDQPVSGSVQIQNLTGPSEAFAVSQCVDVGGLNQPFRVTSQLLVDKTTDGDPLATISVIFYSGAECGTGTELGSLESDPVIGDTGGDWVELLLDTTAIPAGAQVALVSFNIEVGAEPDFGFTARLDDLSFQYPVFELLFEDGFESGDMTGWSGVSPAP